MRNYKKPNILIIHADQHRCDCLGAYGNKDIRTPNIDDIASDGTVYTNSFCSFPVCTPSRYSMLTGLYAHQHLGWNNHSTLPSGIDTFPKILKGSGYHTKAVGKMHFTPTYLDVGFEKMQLAEQDGPGRHDDDYHRYLRKKGLVDRNDLTDQVKEYRNHAPLEYWDTFGAIESNLSEEHHSTSWIGNRAIETLEKWDDSGNLLMAGFIKPHHPFDPPKSWSSMYNPDDLTLLSGWIEDLNPKDGYFSYMNLTQAALRKVMAYYYALISQIDYHVGRMIDVLKRKKLYENTMIIYTSDHGENLGNHHRLLKGGLMYDTLMKIPLIIKYPGQGEKGCISDKLNGNVDLAPTILKVAGCKPSKFMTGQNLLDHNENSKLVFAESGRAKQYMVRSKTRKLLYFNDERKSKFFDLEKDPLEFKNVINRPEYIEQVQEFKNALADRILFDNPSVTHLNEKASVIEGNNVPKYNDGHRIESKAYFKQKMKE